MHTNCLTGVATPKIVFFVVVLFFLKKKKKLQLTKVLTFGDHSLQADDVLVGELAHDGGLAQEVLPLLFRVAGLQRLDGHGRLLPPRHLEDTAVHLPKLPWGKR